MLAGFITRAAAGIVYAVVFILCLVLGIVPTAIFVSVMSGLCCYEFFRMTRLDGKMANERMGIAAAVLFPLSALGDSMLLNACFCLDARCGHLVCLVAAYPHL